MGFRDLLHILFRRKVIDDKSIEESKLSRILGIGDLTALGVGSTLGIGVYVLAGHVAKESAGPSVVLSFLMAAIASIFAGLCYAEFGVRLPRAGSAYVYSYVCIGEFIAFIIGWNLILEYIIGSASVSRGISLYLDTLLNDTLKNNFRELMPVNASIFSDYFDLLAFGLTFVVGVALAFGLKKSSFINNIFTLLNLIIVIFVIAAGSFKADINNWFLNVESKIDVNSGNGGFFPFGFSGTLKGAATCFFGFVGFDCIATTGEEVQNPKRAIPLSIILSLIIIFLSYFGISIVITLMVPYYDQDSIPQVFGQVGWEWAKWIVAIGGIFGLLASLFGSMFPLPRILYAMASDGLIFHFFGMVNSSFKSPIIGTIIASLLTGTMAGLFELKHLVNMMSIGTLMAYTIVAACVLLLRYKGEDESVCDADESRLLLCDRGDGDEPNVKNEPIEGFQRTEDKRKKFEDDSENSYSEETLNRMAYRDYNYSMGEIFRQMFSCSFKRSPTSLSTIVVGILILCYFIFCFAFGLCLIYTWDDLIENAVYAIVLTSIFGFLMMLTVIFMCFQPMSETDLSFKVPLVPLIPAISIFINIYLMLMLDANTWIRFAIWMAIGLPIYLLSLWTYDRGSNYIPHVQKSSINGHMKGNLNYAFENMDECQERERSIDTVLNEATYPPEFTDVKMEMETFKNVFKANIEQEKPKMCHNESEDAQKVFENIDNSLDYGAIEFLDKMIEEEEEACDTSVDTKSMSFDEENSKNTNITLKDEVDEPGDVSPVHVVALVHREDENCDKENANKIVIEIELEPEPEPDYSDDEPEKNETFTIPAPPPMDENYFNAPKSPSAISISSTNDANFTPPIPPPMNEDYFNAPKSPKSTYDPNFTPPKPPPMDENYFNPPKSPKSTNDPNFTPPKPPPMDENYFYPPKSPSALSTKSSNFIIPKPPVMDAANFTQFKSKTLNLSKKKTENSLENQIIKNRAISVDESANKPGEDFLQKLNVMYGSHAANTNAKVTKSMRKLKNESGERKRNHGSEPNLVHLGRIESDKPLIAAAVEQKESPTNKSKEIDFDHTDEPKDKNDIKKMLEAVLNKGPQTKSPRQSIVDKVDNEIYPDVVTDEEAMKAKQKENFTKTMLLQRARFENVLKAIQDKRESVKGDDDDADYNIVLPKLRPSITSVNATDASQTVIS